MKKIMYFLVFASTLTLAACGGDSYSASGSGTIIADGSSGTQVSLPDSTTQPVGTNSEGECSVESRAEGKC